MTKVMIRGGNPEARIAEGFGFLPGAITDQHFLRRNRVNRLLGALHEHPDLVGFGIDEGTAIIVTGSKVRAMGRSYVMVLVPQPDNQPIRVEILEDGEEADLIELSAHTAHKSKDMSKKASTPTEPQP
jgi:cyanophycinase